MKRSYALWFGSFAVVGSMLYVYTGVPLLPIFLGGIVGLLGTYVLGRLKNRKQEGMRG